jgi:hypothetical protein
MGDINRSGSDLVKYDDSMKQKHLQILINEKINLLKQLDVRLDHILTVEVKQIELKQDELKTEIVSIQQELNRSRNIVEIQGE